MPFRAQSSIARRRSPCGVRELAPAVCRTGSPVRAPRTRHMRAAAAPPAVLVGAQHAVPGEHAWLPVRHPPRRSRCAVIMSKLARGSVSPAFLAGARRSRRTSLRCTAIAHAESWLCFCLPPLRCHPEPSRAVCGWCEGSAFAVRRGPTSKMRPGSATKSPQDPVLDAIPPI
jgi:hypothetical protein